jgi:hypothetical protein
MNEAHNVPSEDPLPFRPTTEYLFENNIILDKEPKSTLGDVVVESQTDAPAFLARYNIYGVPGRLFDESLKEDIRIFGSIYKNFGIEKYYDYVEKIATLDNKTERQNYLLTILKDYGTYLTEVAPKIGEIIQPLPAKIDNVDIDKAVVPVSTEQAQTGSFTWTVDDDLAVIEAISQTELPKRRELRNDSEQSSILSRLSRDSRTHRATGRRH